MSPLPTFLPGVLQLLCESARHKLTGEQTAHSAVLTLSHRNRASAFAMYTNLITRTNGPRPMPMESQQGGRRPAPLSTWLNDTDTSQVTDAVVALWLQIDQALHPILGHRGVAALFNRSVKHTAARFPWLGQDPQDALAVVDPSVLKAALLLQTAAEATAGVDSLLQSLRDLLTSLVGSSLTDQLLRSVWAHSPGEATSSRPWRPLNDS